MSRVFRAMAFGALALCSAARPASAQATEEARARELFVEAQQALETGRFAEARDLLEQSLDLTPNPGSAFNLAIALRGMGQPIEAVGVFDALLKGGYGSLAEPQRQQAEALRQEVAAEIATLEVRAPGPREVHVRVDGQRAGRIVSGGMVSEPVNPGKRTVSVSAEGFEPQEQRVTIKPGATQAVRFKLKPTRESIYGTLIIEAVEPRDQVEIVGVARAPRILKRQLRAGQYQVRVVGETGDRKSTVDLDAGQTLRVRLDVQESSLISSPWFWTGVGVLVAATAAGSFFLLQERVDDPVRDPVYGVITTLTAP